MASDIKIQAEEILKVRSRLNELYVGHSELVCGRVGLDWIGWDGMGWAE